MRTGGLPTASEALGGARKIGGDFGEHPMKRNVITYSQCVVQYGNRACLIAQEKNARRCVCLADYSPGQQGMTQRNIKTIKVS